MLGKTFRKQLVTSVVVVALAGQCFAPFHAYAQMPLHVVSVPAVPVVFGIGLYRDDPLKIDFIFDSAEGNVSAEAMSADSLKMARYFLTAMTVPERDMWVNLSPHEPDRIIPDSLGSTEMGRDMLEQDLELKKLTAEILSPDHETGKKFWDRVYQTVGRDAGSALPVDIESFNKVWIAPDRAAVSVIGRHVFITESRLKVMTEDDYTAASGQRSAISQNSSNRYPLNANRSDVQQIIREVVLPVIQDEVNAGERFASLRQMFHAMILAAWYKQNLKNSILNRDYADLEKMDGIDGISPDVRERIYRSYLAVFQKAHEGVMREDYDPSKQTIIARKYVTGGILGQMGRVSTSGNRAIAELPQKSFASSTVRFNDSAMMDSNAAVTSASLIPEELERLEVLYQDSKDALSNIPALLEQYPGMKVLLFLRHAEAFTNLFGRVQTSEAFSPPTGLGAEQAVILFEYITGFKNLIIDQFISSDQERAYEMIKRLAWYFKKEIQIYKGLRELDLLSGIQPGISNKRLSEFLIEDILLYFMQNPDQYATAYFNIQEVKRSAEALFSLKNIESFPPVTMAATHGMTTIFMITVALGIPLHKMQAVEQALGGRVPYGGITGLAYHPQQKRKRWVLLFNPDNSYLPENKREKRKFGELDLIEQFTETARLARIILARLFLMVWLKSRFSDYYPNHSTVGQIPKDEISAQVAKFLEGLREFERQREAPPDGGAGSIDDKFQNSETGSRGGGNSAMLQTPGGIDLDSNKLSLTTEGDAFESFFDPAHLEKFAIAKGLTPVIVRIDPDFRWTEPAAGRQER